MKNVYYERTNGRVWELCQNRFKNNPEHPHNVCAVATSHDQLKEMYDSQLSGGVDWINVNLNHIGEYRLEITTANLAKCEHEFIKIKGEAMKRKRELRKLGYCVTVFEVTATGGLSLAK